MHNKIACAFFQLAMLLGVGAAQAVTPMVAAGGASSFAIDTQGRLFGWGSNSAGQLGRSPGTATPIQIASGFQTKQEISGRQVVAVGWKHTVALKTDGTLWAWGYNFAGQLGDGSTTNRYSPVQIGGGYSAVAAGTYHTVALRVDGTLWAWGGNFAGQLGDGSTTVRFSPVQIGSGYSGVVAASDHTLAIKSDGSLWAWGSNERGQLGDGSTTTRHIPVQVGGGYSAVSAGPSHTFAVKTDGTLWAWGLNNVGQLGDGSTTIRYSPVQIGSGYSAVSAGFNHTLAVKTDGTLWAWGYNYYGQLGDGNTTNRSSPVQIADGFSTVAAGWAHTVAIKTDGTLWAWGGNDEGQLGNGSATKQSTPLQIGNGYSAVAAGGDSSYGYAVAIKTDGTLWAWGSNTAGQLGNGSLDSQSSPLPVGSGYRAVAAGFDHTVALKVDGTLWAWGSNLYGQVGDGSRSAVRASPVQIGSGYSTVAAGSYHTLALKTDGTLWAWGANFNGQLGDGSKTNRNSPVQIGNGYSYVSAGSNHTLALKFDGTLWAWGLNASGQLSDGTTITRLSPVQIGNGYSVVSAGSNHTLALKIDGTLWAWGLNTSGQLGDGTTATPLGPVQIGSGFSGVAAGGGVSGGHTVAVKTDGTAWSWGKSTNGEIGDGTFVGRLSPALVTNETATAPLDLIPEIADNINPLALPSYFLAANKGGQNLNATLTDLRAGGFNGSVYFSALVPKGSSVVQQSNSFASGGTESVCFTGGRTGAKQGPQTPCTPVASGAGVITTGNNFAAYTGASVDPLQGTNAIICMGITLPELSAKGQVLVRAIATGDTPTGVAQCPTVQTEATTRLYRANATGGISNLTMDAVVTPQPEDRGQVRKIYSWAIAPDGRQLMQSETQGWVLMQETMDQAWTLTVPTNGDVTLPIVRGANLSGIAGTLVYVGMGSSWEEVKQLNKAGHYYTIE